MRNAGQKCFVLWTAGWAGEEIRAQMALWTQPWRHAPGLSLLSDKHQHLVLLWEHGEVSSVCSYLCSVLFSSLHPTIKLPRLQGTDPFPSDLAFLPCENHLSLTDTPLSPHLSSATVRLTLIWPFSVSAVQERTKDANHPSYLLF